MRDDLTHSLLHLPSPLFILGPAYSGKSELAHEALAKAPPTTVLGTAGLTEMESRITQLKSLRPDHWAILESHELNDDLSEALRESEQVLIDSINQWLANFMLEGWKYNLEQQEARIDLEIRKLC